MNGSVVCPSIRLSVCHTFFTMLPSSYHHEIFRSYCQWQKKGPCNRPRSEVNGQRRLQRSKPNLAASWPQLQFKFKYVDEMMQKARCCLGQVPYCLSWSSVKFQVKTAEKLVNFDRNWAFRGKVRHGNVGHHIDGLPQTSVTVKSLI